MYMHNPGVQNVESMGVGGGVGKSGWKCDERSTSSPQSLKHLPIESQHMDCDVSARVRYFILTISLSIQVYQRELAN